MKLSKIILLFMIICAINPVFAFNVKNIKETTKNKLEKIKPFKKKPQEPKPKMVETRAEWEINAQNIPLLDREIKKEKRKNEILEELDLLDKKRIRAVCEPETLRDDGKTWLAYYNEQIAIIREELNSL